MLSNPTEMPPEYLSLFEQRAVLWWHREMGWDRGELHRNAGPLSQDETDERWKMAFQEDRASRSGPSMAGAPNGPRTAGWLYFADLVTSYERACRSNGIRVRRGIAIARVAALHGVANPPSLRQMRRDIETLEKMRAVRAQDARS